VEDTGIGFDPSDSLRIFEPFEQGPEGRRLGGLGLGLSIAREIVGMHGGSIGAQSPGAGRGATFRVAIPAR
jgi:signal transduction histidine kinase